MNDDLQALIRRLRRAAEDSRWYARTHGGSQPDAAHYEGRAIGYDNAAYMVQALLDDHATAEPIRMGMGSVRVRHDPD